MANGNGNKKYSDEIKAQAMADILSGMSVKDVAAKYSINSGTLGAWKNRNRPSEFASLAREKKEEIGDKIRELLYTNVETLKELSIQSRDGAWFAKQNADSLAILYGVIADKTILILQAQEPEEETFDGNPVLDIRRAG